MRPGLGTDCTSDAVGIGRHSDGGVPPNNVGTIKMIGGINVTRRKAALMIGETK